MDRAARLELTIVQELNKQFREMLYKKYGLKRGNLRVAIEEAIKLWLSNETSKGQKKIQEIDGFSQL